MVFCFVNFILNQDIRITDLSLAHKVQTYSTRHARDLLMAVEMFAIFFNPNYWFHRLFQKAIFDTAYSVVICCPDVIRHWFLGFCQPKDLIKSLRNEISYFLNVIYCFHCFWNYCFVCYFVNPNGNNCYEYAMWNKFIITADKTVW